MNIDTIKNKGKYKKLNLEDFENELCIRDKNGKSLGFNVDFSKCVIDFLVNKFELSNKEVFEDKFKEAVSGDGNELTKITVVHSSSLCALLCFYNIAKNNLFYEDITYDDVHFEFKNKVIKNPSNMDVVLTGHHKNGKSAILFIECKFSEFFESKKYKLGKSYKKAPYNQIFTRINYDKMTVFQYGIKQLVSHYIGIINFEKLDNKYINSMKKYYRNKDDDRIKLYKKFDIVSFVEVIYKHDVDKYQKYNEETKEVFNALEEKPLDEKSNLKLLGTVTYQSLFEKNQDCLDPAVKKFYNL